MPGRSGAKKDRSGVFIGNQCAQAAPAACKQHLGLPGGAAGAMDEVVAVCSCVCLRATRVGHYADESV